MTVDRAAAVAGGGALRAVALDNALVAVALADAWKTSALTVSPTFMSAAPSSLNSFR